MYHKLVKHTVQDYLQLGQALTTITTTLSPVELAV